jgi:hypothetical protein
MTTSYDEIRKLIERRYRRRLIFGLHLTLFGLTVLGVAWWMMTHVVYAPDLDNLWYLVGWGIFLLVHWGYFRLASARDAEIEAAWARYGRNDLPEKSKPDEANWLALSDDGELIDWTDEPGEKLKRRG